MSIRKKTCGITLDRRTLVVSTAAAVATARLGGYTAFAQDATPVAAGAAACAEPFDASRLSSVTMVTDGSPITVAIVP